MSKVREKDDMASPPGCQMAVQSMPRPCTSALVPLVSASFHCLLILNPRWIILFARAKDATRPWKENGKPTLPYSQTYMMGDNLNLKRGEKRDGQLTQQSSDSPNPS